MDGESVHDNVGNLAKVHKLLPSTSIARFLSSVSKHEDNRKPKKIPESYREYPKGWRDSTIFHVSK